MKVLPLALLGLVAGSSAMASPPDNTVAQVLANLGQGQHVGTYAQSGDWCALTAQAEQLGQFSDFSVTFQHYVTMYMLNYTADNGLWSLDQNNHFAIGKIDSTVIRISYEAASLIPAAVQLGGESDWCQLR